MSSFGVFGGAGTSRGMKEPEKGDDVVRLWGCVSGK